VARSARVGERPDASVRTAPLQLDGHFYRENSKPVIGLITKRQNQRPPALYGA